MIVNPILVGCWGGEVGGYSTTTSNKATSHTPFIGAVVIWRAIGGNALR